MTTPDDIPWYPWHGGTCPVPGDTWTEIKLRDGTILNRRRAYLVMWNDPDIIAYRVPVQPVPQQPAPAEQAQTPETDKFGFVEPAHSSCKRFARFLELRLTTQSAELEQAREKVAQLERQIYLASGNVFDLSARLAERDAQVAELKAEVEKWKQWADYALRRFVEETGKDLQAQET